MKQMITVASWKTKGGANYQAGDQYSWVVWTDSANAGEFHPLIQNSANANSYVRISAAADTAKGDFGTGGGSDVSITAAMQTARATAQVNLWFADWYLAAFNAEWDYVGRAANKATQGDWGTNTEIGKAETTVASKLAMKDAATADKLAVTRWETLAAEEAAAAATDIVRARELLADLVKEIAPLARAETDARVAL